MNNIRVVELWAPAPECVPDAADEGSVAHAILRAMTGHGEEVRRLAMRLVADATVPRVLRAKLFDRAAFVRAELTDDLLSAAREMLEPYRMVGADVDALCAIYDCDELIADTCEAELERLEAQTALVTSFIAFFRRLAESEDSRLGLKNWFSASRMVVRCALALTEQSVARLCVFVRVPMCTLLSIGLERTPKWNERQRRVARALVPPVAHGAAQGARAPGRGA